VAGSPSSPLATREAAPDPAGSDAAVFRRAGFFAAGVTSADGAGFRDRFAFDSASAADLGSAAGFVEAGFEDAGFAAAGFEPAREAGRGGSAPRRVGGVGTDRVTGRFTGVKGTSPLSDGRPALGFGPSEEGSGMLPLL